MRAISALGHLALQILVFVALATFAQAASPIIEPFCGIRHQPSFDLAKFLAVSDFNYWGSEKIDDETSANRFVVGVEVYPGGKNYEDKTVFLSTGMLFGTTINSGKYQFEPEQYYFDATRTSRETGAFLGVGLRQRAGKVAFTYYLIDFDSQVSTYSLYDSDIEDEVRWHSSVRNHTVTRHLLAPSFTATVLRVLDIRLEGWYELNSKNYRTSVSASSSDNISPLDPGHFYGPIRSGDFSYAVQVTLNLARLVQLF